VRENHRVSRGPITAEHLAGLPGLRHTARDALIVRQPKTVLEALSVPDFSRLAYVFERLPGGPLSPLAG
jgi:hypothetical protein